jgi:hypothetical protein
MKKVVTSFLLFSQIILFSSCCRLSEDDSFYIHPIKGTTPQEIVLERVESKIPYGILMEDAKELLEKNFPVEGDRGWDTLLLNQPGQVRNWKGDLIFYSGSTYAYIWKKPRGRCWHIMIHGFKLRMIFDEDDILQRMFVYPENY